MNKLLIITASNNKNGEISNGFKKALASYDIEVQILDLVETELPLYTPKREAEEGIPNEYTQISHLLDDAQAFVFVSPEYNGGIPPVLTNLIAWASRASENWRDSFNRKTAAIATHSGSGGLNLLNALRIQLSYLGLNVLGRQVHTNYGKEFPQNAINAITEEISSRM